jgi:hypothetical protein
MVAAAWKTHYDKFERLPTPGGVEHKFSFGLRTVGVRDRKLWKWCF